MNSLFLNSGDRIDTTVVFTQLRKLFPKVKSVKSVTVLKEFTELEYKDDEMDVKFEFISPHTVEMIYHGDEYVSIDDDEFHIYAGDKTEDGAILEYICYLDFLWTEYVYNYRPDTMGKGLIERINKIKSKVEKIW